MNKKKILNDNELDNVNGGVFLGDGGLTTCPICLEKFERLDNLVTYGSGCSEETYLKCPKCGHEWQ